MMPRIPRISTHRSRRCGHRQVHRRPDQLRSGGAAGADQGQLSNSLWQHGASLYVDGKKVGEGKVGATAAMVFSADDGCDVGVDTGSPVSPDYGARGNEFSGHIKGVQLAIAEDAESVDHLVSPEEAVRIAMARQ